MKPIQVTKPEPEDWANEIHYFIWSPNSESPGFYFVSPKVGHNWEALYSPRIWKEDDNIGFFKSLPEAQEACFQHYLKEIGVEK